MDVLCSDKTGTLTLNKLSVDKNIIEVVGKPIELLLVDFCGLGLECSDLREIEVLKLLTDLWSRILQVFAKGIDRDFVVLSAARAARTENQDAIDAAIVGMLADPKEVHSKPFKSLNSDHNHLLSVMTPSCFEDFKTKNR